MNVELIETKALIEELISRFDHAVFVGMKVRDLPDDPENCRAYEMKRFKGEHRTCQGLIHAAIALIDRERAREESEDDGSW